MAAYKKAVPLADLLKAEMKRRRLTQEQAAAEMQVKQPTINRWLTGAAVPKPLYFDRLATFLDVDEDTVVRAAHLQQQRRRTAEQDFAVLEQRIAELEADLEQVRLGNVIDMDTMLKRSEEVRKAAERIAASQGLQTGPTGRRSSRIPTGETPEEPEPT